MATGDDFVFMRATHGREFPVGEVHRFYRLDIAADDASILIPVGARFAAILDPQEIIDYEMNSVSRAGIEALDARRRLEVDKETPLRPVKVGEFINISHSDGGTNIGVLTLILEGGNSLPIGAANLTVTDPGA